MRILPRRWLGFLALLLVGIGVWSCSLMLALGAYFFPIGPEGLSPRDPLVRQIEDVLRTFAVATFWLGAILLAVFLVIEVVPRLRRSNPSRA